MRSFSPAPAGAGRGRGHLVVSQCESGLKLGKQHCECGWQFWWKEMPLARNTPALNFSLVGPCQGERSMETCVPAGEIHQVGLLLAS